MSQYDHTVMHNVTGNCGLGAFSYMAVVHGPIKKDKWSGITNTYATYDEIKDFVDTPEFDNQFKAKFPNVSCVVISARVCSIGPNGASTNPGQHSYNVFKALSNAKKGMFVTLPPFINKAHPGGDSIILCGIYSPESNRGYMLTDECVTRIGEVIDSNIGIGRSSVYRDNCAKAVPLIKKEFPCLVKSPLKSSLFSKLQEVYPMKSNSPASSVPSVTEVPAKNVRSVLKSRKPKSTTTVTEHPVVDVDPSVEVVVVRKKKAPVRKKISI